MPMEELAIPVGATGLKAVKRGEDYPLLIDTDTFDRAGVDGDEPILPLNRGCEFVGEVLPGEWKKAWDANIDVFTAIISSGSLKLTGLAAVAGTGGSGWINNTHPVIQCHGTELNVAMESPTADTGVTAARDIRYGFYLRKQKAATSPRLDPDYLRWYFDVDEDGLICYITKEIDGAITTLFSGSTYDDASVRDPAADVVWIWRIVFNDGHAGEAAPEDDKHMHVFLKTGANLAASEAATEYELTTSPYELSDILLNVSYPALRIWTEDDTNYYDTGDEAIVHYFRADYPSFDLRYNIGASDRGKGDVELWDGDPDSGGVQVFDEDHVFTNDPYLQNGLVRLHVDELISQGLKLSCYTGAAWVGLSTIQTYLRTSTSYTTYPSLLNIVKSSPEETIVKIMLRDTATLDEDLYTIINISLKRGKYNFEINEVETYPLQETAIIHAPMVNVRWGYAGDNKIADADLPVVATNTTFTDNFIIKFDDDIAAPLMFISTNEKPDGATAQFQAAITDMTLQDYLSTTLSNVIVIVGFTLFSLVTNLFEEAEDATLAGGATIQDPDAAASDLKSVKLDAQNELVLYQITAGTDLPAGRYLAVFRIRDINLEPNDVGLRVRNTSDVEERNEENAQVVQTVTATYAYYSLVFDITDADVTGNDIIAPRVIKLTANANEIYVDYFLIIPIGDGMSWPQDLAHAAMRAFAKPYRVFER